MSEAARHELKQDQLTELLADMETVNGPVSDDELAAVEAVWSEAEDSSPRSSLRLSLPRPSRS